MQSMYINLLYYDAEHVAVAQRAANLKIPAHLIGVSLTPICEMEESIPVQ